MGNLLVTADGIVPEWTPQAMTVLLETARRWPHVRTALLYPLIQESPATLVAAGAGPLSTFASLPDVPHDLLENVYAALLPIHNLNLASGMVAISTRRLSEQLAVTTDRTQRAQLYLNHGSLLRSVGEIRRAIEAQLHALEILGTLPNDPDIDSIILGAVKDLGWAQWRIGNYGDALASFKKSLERYQGFAEGDMRRRSVGYMRTLTNIGDILALLGQYNEATERLREVISLCESTSATDDAVEVELGVALMNLSGLLLRSDALMEATEAARGAVARLKPLAGRDALTYGVKYANALRMLAACLVRDGHPDDGLRASEEAVAVARGLLDDDPEAEDCLGDAFHNLGAVLFSLGRIDAAVEATEDAANIRRGQADRQGVSEKDAELAMSLANLQIGLLKLGRESDALAAGREEVSVYRRLAVFRPRSFASKLAWTLFKHAGALYRAGQVEEALVEMNRVADMYRGLMRDNREYWRSLARVLETLSLILTEVAEPVRAQEVLAELQGLQRYRTIDDMAAEAAAQILRDPNFRAHIDER